MEKQKNFRKNFHLTEFQLRRLQELSGLDGLDPVEHVKKAVDQYLKNQQFDITPIEESAISAEFKSRYEDPVIPRAMWIAGVVDKYEFSALVLNMPSKSGIDKGRISKLSVWDPVEREKTNNFIGSCIVNYDRGWDIRPSKLAQPYYDVVKSLLDK